MRHLSEIEFQRQMADIKTNNEQMERRLLLKAEREKYAKASKFETSKIIAIYLFILLNAIVIYAMAAMWYFEDLSYLGVLISDIAAQVLIYAIYCLKAYHGKKQSELIKFDRDKLHATDETDTDAGAVG